MSTTAEVDLGILPYNGTVRLRATIKKDGTAWTGIDSVTLTLESPDRSTQTEYSMTLETPDAGVWYYDTVSGDLDTTGYWTATVNVVDGTINLNYAHEIGFLVSQEP